MLDEIIPKIREVVDMTFLSFLKELDDKYLAKEPENDIYERLPYKFLEKFQSKICDPKMTINNVFKRCKERKARINDLYELKEELSNETEKTKKLEIEISDLEKVAIECPESLRANNSGQLNAEYPLYMVDLLKKAKIENAKNAHSFVISFFQNYLKCDKPLKSVFRSILGTLMKRMAENDNYKKLGKSELFELVMQNKNILNEGFDDWMINEVYYKGDDLWKESYNKECTFFKEFLNSV